MNTIKYSIMVEKSSVGAGFPLAARILHKYVLLAQRLTNTD